MVSAQIDPSATQTNQYRVPETMKAWVLGGPEELALVQKPVPRPGARKSWCGSTRSRCAPLTSRSSAMASRQ